MGWRFRRGVRVLPGVRLNISKRGISSVSIGRRGLTLNVSRRGTKETIGLPGTGISYTTPMQHSVETTPEAHVVGWLAIGIVLASVATVLVLVVTRLMGRQ